MKSLSKTKQEINKTKVDYSQHPFIFSRKTNRFIYLFKWKIKEL